MDTQRNNTVDQERESNWQLTQQSEENQQRDSDFSLRSAEAGGYGLDRENADEAIRANLADREDAEETEDDDSDEQDLDRDDDTNDTDEDSADWGNVDPAAGPEPSAPGSAI